MLVYSNFDIHVPFSALKRQTLLCLSFVWYGLLDSSLLAADFKPENEDDIKNVFASSTFQLTF
jgi:hypothetical protein